LESYEEIHGRIREVSREDQKKEQWANVFKQVARARVTFLGNEEAKLEKRTERSTNEFAPCVSDCWEIFTVITLWA